MTASWWLIDPPREGFTSLCAQQLNVPIPVDDVTDRETQIVVQRREVLSFITGKSKATRTAGIVSAQIGNRN
jgi:hypothetical protein